MTDFSHRPPYLKAVSVQHDESGGVDALQFDADLSREGEVVHVDGEPQVIVPRPHRAGQPWVSPRLGRLLVPSVPRPLSSAPIQPRWPSGAAGTWLPCCPVTISSTTLLEADAEHHSHRRHDDEGEDGEREAQHQTLVHRDVALCGSRPDHHWLSPLVWEAAAIPHGARAAVV